MRRGDDQSFQALPALLVRAAAALGKSEPDILEMLAEACESARNSRLARAQMERFELSTRPSWEPRYQSQHLRHEHEAERFAILAQLVRTLVPARVTQPMQPSLFDRWRAPEPV